jgi:hypothetical protein
LKGGIALACSKAAQSAAAATGADVVNRDAECTHHLCCALRIIQIIRTQRAQPQAVSRLFDRAKRFYSVQRKRHTLSTTSTSQHAKEGMLAGLILKIQTFLSNILARYPITTTVQP